MIIWIITCLWGLLGCAELAHLFTIMTNRNLQTYTTLCSVFVLAGVFVCMGLTSYLMRKKKLAFYLDFKQGYSIYMWLFWVLACITVVMILNGNVLELADASYEIALGNISNNSIMTVHPFLGQSHTEAMPMRMQILGLSSLYSALITKLQQTPFIIMGKAAPLCIWLLGMMLYWCFSKKLFPMDKDKRWVFMSVLALLILFTSNSPGLWGYRIFHAGYSGETIRAVLLVPYATYVCWQRKWLLAVIAIGTEAFLVWTTYGIGYCAFITVVMLFVHLWKKRRAQHAV